VELHRGPNRKSGEEQQSNQLGDLEWRLVSWGLIEHFTDTESVISAHVNLLKPGGILIVSIPNLRGFNRWQVERWAADLPSATQSFHAPWLSHQWANDIDHEVR
jgi:2-polyprenyl-3-methyl-5-hydroxy-6-metoxy-1,4-benzoquinol methylase